MLSDHLSQTLRFFVFASTSFSWHSLLFLLSHILKSPTDFSTVPIQKHQFFCCAPVVTELRSLNGFFGLVLARPPGRHCEIHSAYDACVFATNYCKNNATCYMVAGGFLGCICKPGFYGRQCSTRNPCLNKWCSGNGTCYVKHNLKGPGVTAECNCLAGSTSTCQLVILLF